MALILQRSFSFVADDNSLFGLLLSVVVYIVARYSALFLDRHVAQYSALSLDYGSR